MIKLNAAEVTAPWLVVGWLLALCALALACGRDSGRTVTLDDLPRLTAVEEQRIGSADDPDVGFSRAPLKVDVDVDGNVFARDGFDYSIRVYAADGRLLRRIGRRGGGPGEFEDVPHFFGVVGDTLWAYESFGGRITLFDREGNVLHTGRIRNGMGAHVSWGGSTSGYVAPRHMRPDGYFVGWFAIERRGDPHLTQYLPIPRVLFDPDGNVVDTLGWLPSPPPKFAPPPGRVRYPSRRILIGSQLYWVPKPPNEFPVWLALPDGHVIVDVLYPTDADAGTFTVTRVGLAGDTLFHRVFSYIPRSYTEELLDSASFRQIQTFNTGVDITPRVDWYVSRVLRAEMQFPPYHLPIDAFWLGNDGVVWLRRFVEPRQPASWILIDPDGDLRGEVALPSNVRPVWSRGATLWAELLDESDIPWLVRYRIAPEVN